MRHSTHRFSELSDSYAGIRAETYADDDAKESLDMAYSKLVGDRQQLCNIQAGGARRRHRFRKTRRFLSPFPHPPRRHRRTHRGKH